MRLTRRNLILAVGGAAGTALLAACGAAPSPPAAAAKPTEAPKPAAAAPSTGGAAKQILYWGSFAGTNGQKEQETVKRFNDSQKDVQVEYQFQGSYEETGQKLLAALAARQGLPDVTLLSEVWWPKLWLNKSITAVDQYMQQLKIDRADYVDPLINEGTKQGKTYWLPFARSTPMLYYNKDHFKEAGLPDKAPETWTEFMEWAPKLAKREGNELKRTPFSMVLYADYNSWYFQGVAWQWGGRYADDDFNIKIDEKPVQEAAQHYQDLVFKHKVSQVLKNQVQDFQNGNVSMMFQSTASLAGIEANSKFPVGTGFLPKGPAGFGNTTGGSGLSILSASSDDKKLAAMQYIGFASSPEHTAWWSQNTGYVPVRKSAVDGAAMNAFYKDHPNFTTAVKQLPLTKPQDPPRVLTPNANDIIGKGLERITISNEPVAQVLKDVKAELEKEAKPVIEQLKKL